MDIEEAIERAASYLRRCQLCPRNCGVNRAAGQLGYCRLDDKARCFREMLHPAEEAALSPSHQIYFAGCNLRCEFCTVAEWNAAPLAVGEADPDRLLATIELRRRQGARNVNLLGGEPAVSILGILKLLGRLRPRTPVVWNSNMYYNEGVDALLCGHIDVCLADLKCGNQRCAEAMLDARDYVEVARRNIRMAREHSHLVVRHLILPGHTECCLRPTLRWLATAVPGAPLSLRTNYVPPADPAAAPKEYVADRDISAARNEAQNLGLRLLE
jgi:putative pyruvate formate lyase activating enzyme